jgi:hypothetical protein
MTGTAHKIAGDKLSAHLPDAKGERLKRKDYET